MAALRPAGPSVPVTKLEQALKTAISAAHNAEKFGSELGYVVRFDADAIKSMAITVLINMSERAHGERLLGTTGGSRVLSPSQVRCFMDCQARWWFKYSLRIPTRLPEIGAGKGRARCACR